MTRTPRTWILAPKKTPKPQVPDNLRAEVQAKANDLVEAVLKPQHVKRPPKKPQFNYITDIWTKWHHSYFYFCATYACPGPNAISPSFETQFARLEYVGGNRFNISYMRHTGKWFELFHGLTLQECLDHVRDDGHFLA